MRVLDEGIGIAGDDAARAFELFFRSKSATRMASGAGIGLFVCRQLVEAMGGRIWAKPRETAGTEVGFSLPAPPGRRGRRLTDSLKGSGRRRSGPVRQPDMQAPTLPPPAAGVCRAAARWKAVCSDHRTNGPMVRLPGHVTFDPRPVERGDGIGSTDRKSLTFTHRAVRDLENPL